MTRTRRGGTLAMVAASTIVIVIVGIALFFLFKIIGGEREIANATDSGALNVAKQVLIDPSLTFTADADEKLALSGCLNSSGKVDLLTYNRMVAQGLLVSLNACAEANPTGIQNANRLMTTIQVGAGSIGGQLADALTHGESNQRWASRHFNRTAFSNSLRMLGQTDQMRYNANDFSVGYCERNGETNVSNGPNNASGNYLTGNIPFRNYETGARFAAPTMVGALNRGERYLLGYRAISLAGLARPIYGVSMQPNQMPHLVSRRDFANASVNPGAVSGVTLPPNAFRTGSLGKEARSSTDANSQAIALVGTPSVNLTSGTQGYVPAIPFGYLYVDNRNISPGDPVDLPSTDNWFAHEAGPGTRAVRTNPPTFGSDVDAWTNRSEDTDINDLPRDNLFKADGTKINSAAEAAAAIPRGANTVTCTDTNYMNTQPCTTLANPNSSGRSPFDIAFGRAGTGSVGSDPPGVLIAAEQAKCWVRTLYNVGDNVTFSRSFGPTGLRVYSAFGGAPQSSYGDHIIPAVPPRPRGVLPSPGQSLQWGPDGCGTCWNQTPPMGGSNDHQCQVTENGTIYDLFNQTTSRLPYNRIRGGSSRPGPGAVSASVEVQRFIRQRMRQIKPNCTAADYAVVEGMNVALGEDYFIYLENQRDPLHSGFVVRRTAPTYAAGFSNPTRASTPDGTECIFSNTYEIGYSMVNPPNDFRIHDHMFMNDSVSASSVDEASYQPSSGTYGLLGVIKFRETVSGNGQMSSRD